MEQIKKDAVLYSDVTVTEKQNSEIEIVGEVPTEIVHTHRIRALKKLQKDLELPGFRKGHVPEEIALEHIGEIALLEKAAESALSEAYTAIVMDKKIDVVGKPAVTITKIASGNPIGFKITSAVYPEVELPDYKKIASSEVKKHDNLEDLTVDEKELDAELKRLQGILARAEENAKKTEGDNVKKEGQDTSRTPESTKVLPEITDEFAQKLGDFKDLADLKDKISKGLTYEKKQKAHDKRRLAIADAIIAKSKVTVPNIFIEGEIDQMMASFEERVRRSGMKIEDYLKQVNKTAEQLRSDWRADAEKRAKLQLIFNEISKKENISPDSEKLDREVRHIKEHYPDAQEHSIRVYVRAQMTNNLVFEMLEGNASKAEKAS